MRTDEYCYAYQIGKVWRMKWRSSSSSRVSSRSVASGFRHVLSLVTSLLASLDNCGASCWSCFWCPVYCFYFWIQTFFLVHISVNHVPCSCFQSRKDSVDNTHDQAYFPFSLWSLSAPFSLNFGGLYNYFEKYRCLGLTYVLTSACWPYWWGWTFQMAQTLSCSLPSRRFPGVHSRSMMMTSVLPLPPMSFFPARFGFFFDKSLPIA